jgi:hypothetical protein
MQLTKIREELTGVAEFAFIEPRVTIRSLPTHQKLGARSGDTVLKNRLNFKLSSTVGQECRRWYSELIIPTLIKLEKKGHMEYIIHLHAGRKFELIS